ncbi:hypothetical protein [Roseovarius salis]|uniref:hypothetical protein n=1 Tax=Roseovarius salis TaxID=3376063 RepID=UPI0037CC7F55
MNENQHAHSAQRARIAALVAALMAAGACAAPEPGIDEDGFIKDLPANVAEMAAPNQNLDAVRLRPQDGCYWYRYDGPVETVMVPLRADGGGKICTSAAG